MLAFHNEELVKMGLRFVNWETLPRHRTGEYMHGGRQKAPGRKEVP